MREVMEKVSVIIPIYKVESYLEECVESVRSQSYSNLEIILVDDGSPDECPAMCDRFEKEDTRIIVIHQKNGGLSAARNTGLRIASGQYIYFVDSDDRLPEYSVEWMIDCIHATKSDMVIAGFERFYDTTGEVFFKTCTVRNETVNELTREEAIKDFYRDGCQAWAVLYKKEVHAGIYFPEGEINEDEAIVFQLLERCQKVTVTDKVVYSYRNREESITTSGFSTKRVAWYHHCQDNLAWICEHHPEVEIYARKRLCGSILWLLREIALSKEEHLEIRKMLLNDLRINYKNYTRTNLSSTDRLKLGILKYFPYGVFKRIEVTRFNRYLKRSGK